LTRRQIHPAISRLEERRIDGIHLARVEQFGRPGADPIVSIIVPLYGRIDFLEQQLAQFVHDPDMREVDLVYVLDSPELATALLRSAGWMEALYGVPFRVAITDRNGGFAAVNNLGASISRGRLLLLMNSDVLPLEPGWLAALIDAYDSIPNVGVIAPRLLYEDGSLQHAGLYFHFDRLSATWNNEHFYKGLHASLPAAQVRREVPAVTAACLMIASQLYAEVGGLRGAYVQGDYEDSDLCLRLAERGLGVWYVPEATLYHLEGQSYPSEIRELTGRYNRWLHTELWHDRIVQVMSGTRVGPIPGEAAAKGAR
jgi:GT2 family glycosyltransferase